MNILFLRVSLSSTDLPQALPNRVYQQIDPGIAFARKTVFDLVQLTEAQVLALPGVGPKSLRKIKEWLAGHKMKLGMRIDVLDWLGKLDRAQNVRRYHVAGSAVAKEGWLKSFATAVADGEEAFEVKLSLHSNCYLIRSEVRARVRAKDFARDLQSHNGHFHSYHGRLQVCTGEKYTECPVYFPAVARLNFGMTHLDTAKDGVLWVDIRGMTGQAPRSDLLARIESSLFASTDVD